MLKRMLLFLGFFITLPLIVMTLLEAAILGRQQERVLASCKELLSIVPTIFGEYMRLGYYWAVCKEISPDALLMFGSMVAHRNTVIKAGTVVGSFSIIGYAEIGEHVLMGARVSLISGKYQHGRPEERSSGAATVDRYETIRIGKSCWIGQDAIIMANIGENCTIGAGSVVYKDVPPNSTFMGNPARRVSVEPTHLAKDQ